MRILFTGGSGLLSPNWVLIIRKSFDVILGLPNRRVGLIGVNFVDINPESFNMLNSTIKN
jgi:hypothetical protein